jgi:hypothetical protein
MSNEYLDRLRDEPRPLGPEIFNHREREMLQLFRDLIRDSALAIAVELRRIALACEAGGRRRQSTANPYDAGHRPKLSLTGKGTVK